MGTITGMNDGIRVEICAEHDPDIVYFVTVLPEYPRSGDIVGDLIGGAYRVEKRFFLLGKEVDGIRPVIGVKALCKEVIV